VSHDLANPPAEDPVGNWTLARLDAACRLLAAFRDKAATGGVDAGN
jgi:hypothetical protein